MNPVTILAIICITILEIVAITQGVNGALLAGTIAVIAGLGGYQAHRVKSKKNGKGTPPSE